jgi:hypothetical protein
MIPARGVRVMVGRTLTLGPAVAATVAYAGPAQASRTVSIAE